MDYNSNDSSVIDGNDENDNDDRNHDDHDHQQEISRNVRRQTT